MTANLINHVVATFGGRAIRFELPREEIVALEESLDGGAYACLNCFVRGEWRLRDLQLVLSAAVPVSESGVDPKSPAALLQRVNRQLRAMAVSPQVVESPFVLRVLKENPPARYSVLALKVLEAALFGIPEAESTFDENAAEASA